MAGVVLKNIYKIYPSRDKRQRDGVAAVKDFNIEIEDNEFIVFVGPSGCGKSTTLRMIAGLEEISSGELYIDGQYMNDVEPKDRDIAMVFQNYALYPHMTAYKNIAFGLSLRKFAFPIYDENNEAVKEGLSKVNEHNLKIKELLKESKKISNSLIPLSNKISNKKKQIENIDIDLNKLSSKHSLSRLIQLRVSKLNSAKEKLVNEVNAFEEEVKNIKNKMQEIRNDVENRNNDIKNIYETLKPYQKYEIDKKSLLKNKKNLAYYEKVEAKDKILLEKDLNALKLKEDEEKQISEILKSPKYQDKNDLKAQNESYRLELNREALLDEIKFLKEEIEVLNIRKENLNNIKSSTQKKIDLYTSTPQPVFAYRKYTKEEIDYKVKKAADILDINELLDRKPREMSGGQRQRIALGRAIVRSPKVFLLDEPLSNLDAKLRATMRAEISNLHEKLKTTFIYVTHDQVEAMTMGTRIVVMKDGIIQQIDSPTNLFDFPNNTFVAGFIGTPQMNFFKGVIRIVKGKLFFKAENSDKEVTYDLEKLRKIKDEYCDGLSHKVILGVRGEDISITKEGYPVKITLVELLGSESHIHVNFGNEIDDVAGNVVIKLLGRINEKVGDTINIQFKEEKMHLFDQETTNSIMERSFLNK